MRLLFSVVRDGQVLDLAADVEDDARVADLAVAVADRLGHPEPGPEQPSNLRVLGGGGDQGPPLYVGRQRLDPQLALAASPIRHASLVGLGVPAELEPFEPSGRVEVRHTGGPMAGDVVRLGIGEFTLGPGKGCDITVDPLALPAGSPEVCADVVVHAEGHVTLTVRPEAEQVDFSAPSRRRVLEGPIVLSTIERKRLKKKPKRDGLPDGTVTVQPADDIPLVHLDRNRIEPGTEWEYGAQLNVGDVLLCVERVSPPDAAMSLNPQGATLDYNRPPRLLPAERETEFTLPTEPSEPENQYFPLMMVLLPIALGLIMYWFTKSPYSLIIMAMSPLMALSTYTMGRRQNRKRYVRDLNVYMQRTDKVQKDAHQALLEERAARRRDFADPAELMLVAVGPRARLWERRPSDPDFLCARVGTADQQSEVRVKDPQREAHEGDLMWTAPDVPVTVPLASVGVTGIAGPDSFRMTMARWILGQTAVLQSPADVDMVLLTDVAHESDWHWVRWLQHLRSDTGDAEVAHLGTDEESINRRIGELLDTMNERLKETETKGTLGKKDAPVPGQPMLVILDGARELRLLPGVPELLKVGPMVGIYFICLDTDRRLLPEECQAVISGTEQRCELSVTHHPTIEAVRPDLVSVQWAELVARTMAPVRDISDIPPGGSLPGSSRLLDVLALDPPTSQAVLQRWEAVGRTTQAVIGERAEEAFAIDIRKDGPHGLVAGTTGSGKSELLQTIIASLAADNRPDEMNFVLIDYKGGAAFKDCNNLPHTVGMVSDLDGHLTTRALESLGAELRRREHQLAGADAKDIEDYQATMRPGDEPMPRLLIVIDEFAALVAELPDFVNGLVDIARRGRSLGVHLILATQRPAGVVSAEIKSNTNLRIALRVTDQNDSQDVIEANDAAQIAKSTPGRAYARLGHSSLIAFQSSRVGGRPRPADARAEIQLHDVRFKVLGTGPAKQAVDEDEEDVSIPTDLASLVQATQEASAESGVTAPPSPWLPALPEVVTTEEILGEHPDAVPSRERLSLPFGMVDIPSQQRRDIASFDLESGGHLAVIGGPRTGRSALLRAMAGVVGSHLSPEDVHMYGVDCGNNALLPLVGLPHVGAVVSRDQTDRMTRLVRRLQQIVTQRQQDLALQGFADVSEQRRNVDPAERMPYILILFDRWEGFFQAYDSLDSGALVEAWQQLLQEGGAVGIRIVMTGDRSLMLGRMAALLDDKLVLRLIDPADFGNIGMTSKAVPTHMPPGRAFRADGLRETQVALLTDDPNGTAQVAALQTIGREATARWQALPDERRPFRLDILPMRIDLAEARKLQRGPVDPTDLVLAVGGDNLGLRTLNAFEHGPAMLVTGGRRTGRSTVLRTMATFALDAGWNLVVITPRMSPLRDLAGHPQVHGPFDTSADKRDLTELLEKLLAEQAPLLTLVDDLELLGSDDWLPELLTNHIGALRDTGSVLAAAGSPQELSSMYRGPIIPLKRSGSGLMLAPSSSYDSDLFGARLTRSALGQSMPPGGGFLVRSGGLERVQVIWPE